MPSGGDQSPPPPPPPPAAAASEEEDEDGEAEDAAQPAGSPAPQTQQRFEELCSRLNMDEAARAEAWDSYRSMSESYTLEVRPGRGDGLPGPSRPPAAGLRPSEPVGRRAAGLPAGGGRGSPARRGPGNPASAALCASPGATRCRCSSRSRSDRGTPPALKQRREAGLAMPKSQPPGRQNRCRGQGLTGRGRGLPPSLPAQPGFRVTACSRGSPSSCSTSPPSRRRVCLQKRVVRCRAVFTDVCTRGIFCKAHEVGFLPSWSETRAPVCH